MPKKKGMLPLLDGMPVDIAKIVDNHANDRVISQGLSVRLKTFVPYREICMRFNMSFCAPLQEFMELFVAYYSDKKRFDAAMKRYGKEHDEQKVHTTKRPKKERKPCDKLFH
jgi:hypothetical protein